MRDFPMEKYRFIVQPEKRRVIALTRFGGKVVRAEARCNPADKWDEEIGKKLASHRCNIKVAEKREKRAIMKLNEATIAYQRAQAEFNKAMAYATDATEDTSPLPWLLLHFFSQCRCSTCSLCSN